MSSLVQFLLLSLITGFLVNGEIWNEPPRKFTTGEEYLFHYEGQILTGIPSSSWHYSGYRFSAFVFLKMEERNQFYIRLRSVRFIQLNNEINVDIPTVFLPQDWFQEINDKEILRLFQQQLQLPIRFIWTDGIITRMEVKESDTEWSINLKKGILNMLNIDLSIRKDEDRIEWNGAYRHSRYEEGIEGRCRSVYHWNHLPVAMLRRETDDRSAPLTMVKTRDINDCMDTVGFERRNFLRKDCSQKIYNVSTCFLGADSTVRANVTYWQRTREFFFWGIETNAKYTFSLSNPNLGSFSTFVKQNLTFIKDVSKGGRVNDNGKMSERGRSTDETDNEGEDSIKFVSVANLRMNLTLSELPWTQENLETQSEWVRKLFTRFQKELEEKNSEMLKTTQCLISMLRKAPKSLLLRLHQECVKSLIKQPELLHWFYDLLPSIGTKEALEVLVEATILPSAQTRLKEKFVTDSESARRITAFSMMNPVREQNIIVDLMKLATSATLQRDRTRRETFKSTLLAIGTLCHSHRNIAFKGGESTSSVLTLFKKLMMTNIPALPKEEKLIVIVKALGNCGIRTSLPVLRKLLFAKDSTLAVQVQCVYSFRKLASLVPEEVRKITLPIFFDVTKDTELRIASYLISMRTRPNRILLNSLMEFILQEPVKQVKSFVLSHLRDLSTSPCTCDCELVRNVSQILENVQLDDTGIQYSHTHRLTLTESLAAVLRSGIIFAPDDFLPRSSNIRIFTDFQGQETPVLEAGFRSKGIQKLLSKFIGPNGKLLSGVDLHSLLKSMDLSGESSDVNFSLYMKLFNEEVGVWLLDEDISETLKKGFLPLTGNMFDFLNGEAHLPINFRRNYFIEETVRIATVFGLPFTTKLSFILHAQINGTMKMKQGFMEEEYLHGQMKVQPLILSQFVAQADVDAPIGRASIRVKLEAHLPFDKELVVDARYKKSEEGMFQVQIQRPQEEWNLFQINCSMITMMKEMKGNSEFLVNVTRLPMKYEMLPSFSSSNGKHKRASLLNLEPLGLQLKSVVSFTPSVTFMNPTNFPFKGPFFVNASLKNIDQKQYSLEFRVLSTRRATNERNLIGNRIQMQLLRAPGLMDSGTDKQTKRSGKPLSDYLNSFFRQTSRNEEEALLSELTIHTQPIDTTETRMTATLNIFDHLEGSSQINLTLKTTIQIPRRTTRFEMSRPLQLQSNERSDNVILFNSHLLINDEDILNYQMKFGMDPNTRKLFQEMSENPTKFRFFHPLTKQCAEDMKRKWNNSLACFNTWTSMNILNRMDHKLVVPKRAPSIVKKSVSYMMNNKLWLIRHVVENINILDESQSNGIFRNLDSNDKIYAASLVTSPFQPRHITVDYLFDRVMLHVPSMSLPKLYITSMFPMEKSLYSSLLRYSTERLYPATCYLHNSRERATHIQTFDGLQYNLPNVTSFFHSKQILLTQDVNRNFQVSLLWTSQRRIVQIMTQHMTSLIQVIGDTSKGINQVLVNSKPIQKMPLTLKSKEGAVIVHIQSVNDYMVGEGSVIQISLPLLGLHIRTDLFTFIHTQVSPFFHTSVRGLCGDFDGERRQEIKSADCKRFVLHPEDVIYSAEYVRPLNDEISTEWIHMKTCQSEHLLTPMVPKSGKMKKSIV